MRKVNRDIADKIKFLRQKGYSVPEISREVQISKTSILRYINGVKILPEFLQNWAGKRGGSKKIKLLKEKKAMEEMKQILKHITKREKLIILSTLYWAEGEKKDLSLANTDPNLVRVFVNSMREIFNIGNDRLRMTLRVYEDLDKENCISFWSGIVGIPRENIINIYTLTGKKKGKLKYGMCRVRITKGADLLKKMKAVNSIISEFMSL